MNCLVAARAGTRLDGSRQDAVSARARPRARRPGALALSDGGLRDEVTELCRDLIRIDTSNPPGRETPAAELLAAYLGVPGIECELAGPDPERLNLIARLEGDGGGAVADAARPHRRRPGARARLERAARSRGRSLATSSSGAAPRT